MRDSQHEWGGTASTQAGEREMGARDGALVELDDPEGREPDVVGNKAARLARLRDEGFDVPPGWVVTADWCAETVDGADDVVGAVEAAREALGEAPNRLETFERLLERAREVWPIREENVAFTRDRCLRRPRETRGRASYRN